MALKTELHCHNMFSNFQLGKDETPYDCNVTIRDQLEQANQLGLDAVFITNHNTLDGYSQILQYKNDHLKFKNIQIYPAEEITTADGAHVLAYGINQKIEPGLTIEEIIDQIRNQNGVSCAPHPFSIIDSIREKANQCEMIEVFNSNNIDIISNAKASHFALENNKIKVAGSDSHVVSTFGRCVNVIESENNLDDVMSAMKHNKIEIQQTGYALPKETLEHLKYKINNSRDFIFEYVKDHYPNSEWIFSFLYKMYNINQNSYLWSLMYKMAIYFMKRVSYKINYGNREPEILKDRNLVTMFKIAIR